MIDLDYTFFVQFINFVLILILFNVLLVAPIRKIMKQRAEFMGSQMDSIETFAASADKKLADYEKALDDARKTATQDRLALKQQGLDQEKDILGKVGAEVAESLGKARTEIASQTKAAKGALEAGVDAMAKKAVGKILGGVA
jgi:F-type H+-transporting ATPase subunit b